MSYKLPPVTHGIFISTVTQSYSGSTTAGSSSGQPVYFDTGIDVNSGISLVATTGVTVTSSGDYLFTISAIISQTSSNNIIYEMWFIKNGVLIDDSNTRIQNNNPATEAILAVPMILDLVAGDIVGLRWYCSSANGQILAFPATGSVRPRIPSIILSANKISE
jgi:hypothetical protein